MESIHTTNAPSDPSPLSQAIRHGDTVYVSGQAALDPETAEPVPGTVREQTARTFENIGEILEAAGSSLENVVKTTVYITDIGDFEAVNAVYREHMSEPYPARSAVEVSDLAVDIKVEIDAVAAIE